MDDDEVDNNGGAELDNVFVCEICTREFVDRGSLWLHMRATHREEAAFACGICLKICSDNHQLIEHVSMYHQGSKLDISEQRRYSCSICGRQHDSRKKLINHVSIHIIDPSCDPSTYVQLNTNYYPDNNVNSGENAIMGNDLDCDDEAMSTKKDCYICCKSFPNEDQLIRHQRNAHKSEMSGDMNNGTAGQNGNGNRAQYHLFFVCELCNSSHPSKWERWLHVNNEHANEPAITVNILKHCEILYKR